MLENNYRDFQMMQEMNSINNANEDLRNENKQLQLENRRYRKIIVIFMSVLLILIILFAGYFCYAQPRVSIYNKISNILGSAIESIGESFSDSFSEDTKENSDVSEYDNYETEYNNDSKGIEYANAIDNDAGFTQEELNYPEFEYPNEITDYYDNESYGYGYYD